MPTLIVGSRVAISHWPGTCGSLDKFQAIFDVPFRTIDCHRCSCSASSSACLPSHAKLSISDTRLPVTCRQATAKPTGRLPHFPRIPALFTSLWTFLLLVIVLQAQAFEPHETETSRVISARACRLLVCKKVLKRPIVKSLPAAVCTDDVNGDS